MDDPWDVKSVRQAGHYTSCMKLNGVPLLPPVLSKECYKEMQYYKLLAKEVERRISILQPYIETDTDTSDEKTDVAELSDSEIDKKVVKQLPVKLHPNNVKTGNISKGNVGAVDSSTDPSSTVTTTPTYVDFNFKINVIERSEHSKSKSVSPSIEVPERDYNCVKTKNVLTDTETEMLGCTNKKRSNSTVHADYIESTLAEILDHDLPSLTFSTKSYTGSLDNINALCIRKLEPKELVRQSSYTILNPSPELLAHLEVQSVNLGVDVNTISMSESMSNLSSPKKRRNWDLETAKKKWSNMAMELKQKNMIQNANNRVKEQNGNGRFSPPIRRNVAVVNNRRSSAPTKSNCKSEPHQKNTRHSPVRHLPTNKTNVLEEGPMSTSKLKPRVIQATVQHTTVKRVHEPNPLNTKESMKTVNQKKEPELKKSATPKSHTMSEPNTSSTRANDNHHSAPKSAPIPESEDPTTKVKQLYEKIQKQQLMQMTSLMERQKREKTLLQQAFEEQNNLLYRQLKTICPKAPEEVKEAWGEKVDIDRGPVSLSQLINTPQQSGSPVATTLSDSNKFINQCENVLKMSRDLSNSITKQPRNVTNTSSPKPQSAKSRAPPTSPTQARVTSRRLNYDTSSSERDYELILTDRTNDTLADLNVTFPSDSDDCRPYSHCAAPNDVTLVESCPAHRAESAITTLEKAIHKSINNPCGRRCQYSSKQLAAASTIVAYARGYLVRRLMRTGRVQATVQTIKDALLCALQLHQDREGIRGADVDLHRRLIQQITAACYNLHDTFISSTAADRCALIAADRNRRDSLAARTSHRHEDTQQ